MVSEIKMLISNEHRILTLLLAQFHSLLYTFVWPVYVYFHTYCIFTIHKSMESTVVQFKSHICMLIFGRNSILTIWLLHSCKVAP